MKSATITQADLAEPTPKLLMKGDRHIWGIFIALCVISIIELYSASSREVGITFFGVIKPLLRHVALLGAGFGIVWYLSRKHYSKLLIPCLIFVALSVVLMVVVNFAGDVINGARRSFTLPVVGVRIFPAEMIKLSAIISLAFIMASNQDPKKVGITRRGAYMASIVIMVMSGLLISQGITNTLLLVGISFAMMIISGVKMKDLLRVMCVYIACMAVLVSVLYFVPGGLARLETLFARLDRHGKVDIEMMQAKNQSLSDVDAKDKQEVFSKMAQANGGVIGVFPGNSREASRLPLAFSDYIYAIIVEEMGLAGGLVVLALYLWLLGRSAAIASKCSRTLPALLVIGMALLITFQALFHVGIVSGFFPVSGQPLPLISKGGTSILVTAICFGIMLSVSRSATRKGANAKDKREEEEALPEEMREANTMQL